MLEKIPDRNQQSSLDFHLYSRKFSFPYKFYSEFIYDLKRHGGVF